MSIADARDVLVIFFGTRADKSLGVLAATTNPKLWVTRLYNNNVIVVPNNVPLYFFDGCTQHDMGVFRIN